MRKEIVYLMLNFGTIGDRIKETLDLYFQQRMKLVFPLEAGLAVGLLVLPSKNLK